MKLKGKDILSFGAWKSEIYGEDLWLSFPEDPSEDLLKRKISPMIYWGVYSFLKSYFEGYKNFGIATIQEKENTIYIVEHRIEDTINILSYNPETKTVKGSIINSNASLNIPYYIAPSEIFNTPIWFDLDQSSDLYYDWVSGVGISIEALYFLFLGIFNKNESFSILHKALKSEFEPYLKKGVLRLDEALEMMEGEIGEDMVFEMIIRYLQEMTFEAEKILNNAVDFPNVLGACEPFDFSDLMKKKDKIKVYFGSELVAANIKATESADGKRDLFSYRIQRKLSEEAQKNLAHHEELVRNEVIHPITFDILNHHRIGIKKIYLRGDSGVGKSSIARQVAVGLGLPLLIQSCSASTEAEDLVQRMVPVFDNQPEQEINLDSFDKPEDFYAAMMKQMVQMQQPKNQWQLVDSPVLEAMRKGYVIEIQEPNAISQPGALVALNGILEEGQIRLISGETVYIHPDTVIIITANVGYEGTRQMNQAFIDRFGLIYDVPSLTAQEYVKRYLSEFDFYDRKVLEQMAEVLESIEIAVKEQMMEGSCGYRAFRAWAQSTNITKNPVHSAINTVVNRCTADEDEKEDIMSILKNSPLFAAY